ncbi:MAG: PIN domain-containing protein [Acidimicrobiales bacterium]
MIGLDTNVLVRYVTQDDPEQSRHATTLIESLDEGAPGFVSVVALVELHWVLRRAYKVSRRDTATVIRKLLDARELVVQEADAARRALACLRDDIDFSDALIGELGTLAGCSYTATFDRTASGLPHMKSIPDTDTEVPR